MLAMKLSLITAQRIGEVVGLAVSELSLNNSAPMWVIPGARTKNGEPNRVPLSPFATHFGGAGCERRESDTHQATFDRLCWAALIPSLPLLTSRFFRNRLDILILLVSVGCAFASTSEKA